MKEMPKGIDRDAIVRAVSAAVKPKRIILFGSKARGDDRPDSDTDICVIVDRFEKEWIDASMAIRNTLSGAVDGPFDLLVYTDEVFRDRSTLRSTLEGVISREGLLLYESA